MPVVRSIVDEAAADNYKFSSLIKAVVMSDPFRKSMKLGDQQDELIPGRDQDARPELAALVGSNE
jgi:hypothetical protein